MTQRNVEAGKHVGFFIYENGELIGWTGSGPKASFPLLQEKLGSRLSKQQTGIWSIGCIALTEQARGRGLSDQVTKAVIDLAHSEGASAIEAYPTRPWDEPRKYRGSFRMYQRLGFVEKGAEKDGDSEILWMQYSFAPEVQT